MNRIETLSRQLAAVPCAANPIIRKQLANPNMSQLVEHNGVVYVAGQVGTDFTASVAEQTAQVLAKIDALLAEARVDKTRLLTANVCSTYMLCVSS
jgi:enamine deaminase RidA (YjgF/YER057c/UK114 family)